MKRHQVYMEYQAALHGAAPEETEISFSDPKQIIAHFDRMTRIGNAS